MRDDSVFYSYFLGPKGENGQVLRELINLGIDHHLRWRQNCYAADESLYRSTTVSAPSFRYGLDKLKNEYLKFLVRLEDDSIPFFHPRYAAQMLKVPSIPAVLAYVITMLNNPNNHAYEGGPVTTEMEMEVVEQLLKLVGFDDGWGHISSGGSLANMEALWAIRDFRKQGKVVFSKGSHFSWKRICSILRIDDFEEIEVDKNYRIDLDHLQSVLKKDKVMLVMANLGTTGCGAVDNLEEIIKLKEKYGFHLHVDAAYGGYTKTVIINEDGDILPYEHVSFLLKPEVYRSLVAMQHADSVTIDPHKHGLVPYGAGSVLYKDTRLRDVILNTAPYTYHVEEKPNIGRFTLEGSRPGASAAACWFTYKIIPLHRNGFGAILGQCIKTAKTLCERLQAWNELYPLTHPDLDILCFYRHPHGTQPSLRKINQATTQIYEQLSVENPQPEFILSKFIVDTATASKIIPNLIVDDETLTSMRAVFIKHWMLLDGRFNYLDKLIHTLKSIIGAG